MIIFEPLLPSPFLPCFSISTVGLGYTFGINNDDVATAKLGMVIAFFENAFVFAWAWGLLSILEHDHQ
jgi:hypothetical protein